MKLSVSGLTKEYRAFAGMGERLLAALSLGLYGGSIRFRALDGIEFEAGERGGEIIGLIGPNGAGKSTLLRILAGVTPAPAGRVRFAGSVRGILELGVGFSPDLDAYENIYYNGRLWGYSHRELRAGTDEIIAFARLENFAAMPLKTYSSGMQIRLGFALATFRRSDLVLVDEALAVGDASFQQKCLERLRAFRAAGSLVLVVSHDVALLGALSDRMLLLYGGRLVAGGAPDRVAERYMQLIAEESRLISGERPLSEGEYSLKLFDGAGGERSTFFPGEEAEIRVLLLPIEDLRDVTVGIHINDRRGVRVFGTNTHLFDRPLSVEGGRAVLVRFRLTLNLGPGGYSAGFSVHRGRVHSRDCYLWREGLVDFVVENAARTIFEGTTYLAPDLSFEFPDGGEFS